MTCVERLCKGVYGTKCRQLVHGDNMALVLTQCRWRSRLFALIVILRRAAAYILARDMVIVSRWTMSEMKTSDAPSRLQEQHQPQDQLMHATDEQAQSGACLARACEYSASNDVNQSACSMSERNTVPPALPYSTSGYPDDGVRWRQTDPLRRRALIARERLESKPCTSVFVGKGHAPNTNTRSRQRCHNGERSRNNPSTPKDLVRRSRSTASIVGVPHGERRSSKWDEPLTTWSSRPSDSAELRCIPPGVRELVGTTTRKIVTDAENDAAMSTWTENEFMKGNPASSGERLPSAGMDKYPSFGRHGARKLPKTWRSLQGWQRLSPGRSRQPGVRAVWSGIACRLARPAFHGLLVMTRLLSFARPGELLRMIQCDLVPPLRGTVQNFSIILAAEETGRPTKVQTFNDTLELDGPLARKLVPFWMALRGRGSKSRLWPFTYPIFCRFSRKRQQI